LNRKEMKGYPLREQRSLYRIAEWTLTDRRNSLGVEMCENNEERPLKKFEATGRLTQRWAIYRLTES